MSAKGQSGSGPVRHVGHIGERYGLSAMRANAIWKRQLRDYVAPDLDHGIDEALQAFIAKRKEVLPDGVS